MAIYHKYTTLPYRSVRGSTIHNWDDIVLFGMQSLGPMGSSLTHTLKVFLSPHGQQGKYIKQDLFCMWSFGPMAAALPTHNQGTFFSLWAVRKNASSKVERHWPGSDSVGAKATKTKLGDHQEIKHGIRLKQHKAHRSTYIFKYIVYTLVISKKS